MTKTNTVDVFENPLLAAQIARPEPQGADEKGKDMSSADERGRKLSEAQAEARKQAAAREWDEKIVPALRRIEPALGKFQRLVLIATKTTRVGTIWQSTEYPLGRIYLDKEGTWWVCTDRDEMEKMKDARTAMTRFIEIMKPVLKQAEREREIDRQEPSRRVAQEKASIAVRRARVAAELGVTPEKLEKLLAAVD